MTNTSKSGKLRGQIFPYADPRAFRSKPNSSSKHGSSQMLGNSRVIATASGMCYDAEILCRSAESRAYRTTCSQNYTFEGKERGTETQNDNFEAREYSWRFGRWLSSDWSSVPEPVPYANLSNPQTLNLYAMVKDDPESFADLDGHITNPGQEAQTACATNQQCAENKNGQATDQKPDPAQNQSDQQTGQNQPSQPGGEQPPASQPAFMGPE